MVKDAKKVKRKDATAEQIIERKEEDSKEKIINEKTKVTAERKFGPPVTFPYQRVWSRCILILGVLLIVWYNSKKEKEIELAKHKDFIMNRAQALECSEDYKAEVGNFPGCLPTKCGRLITDKLITATETDVLLNVAINGLSLGGSDGGASILDLHTGALSKGTGFINIYSLQEGKQFFNQADVAFYKIVKTKIQSAIAHHFGVNPNKIYLTKPTFFSRMTSAPAKTVHDEYWHPHVDKETYESFHYTSLLYLNDFERDFKGGRFVFMDKNVNSTVEPRKGRVSIFTSGRENLHVVERVTSGTRYALTVSFTCDINAAIADPSIEGRTKKE
ncbi:2-oxoglutarate and iron-dependent oxygenase domain-containing protein 3-like [Prorops nasuta]|uniref:2-oxoglutarate and iron-dependent oxygenase domain-containing protein 3-like n=1 Tax=Prorops nasuta TaxID=863751 RepID=UPI0034CFA6CC